MDNRVYTERKILAGVLLGGPLAGGYFLWRDFKALDKPTHAIVAAIGTLIVTIATFSLLFLLPDTQRLPNIVFPAIQIGLALGVIKGFLADAIDAHVQAERPVFGWGNTILVAILFLVVTLIPIGGLAFAMPNLFDATTSKNYGHLKHEIQFDRANISELEVDQIAGALSSGGFFDEGQQKTVDAAKAGNRYVIMIYCNETIRTDPEALQPFIQLRNDVQKSFPANTIVLDLVIGTPDNLFKRLE